MERLTYWNKETECWSYHGPGGEAAKRLAAYEDTGLEPEEINRVLNAYGRGMTLRTNAGERLEIIKDLQTERLKELAQAEKDGRLVVLQDGITVHGLQNEYCTARHMADERLPSPSYTTGHIAGFGEGAIHILDKILTREETEAVPEKREGQHEN